MPLKEGNWQRLDVSGIRPASRSDLLTALADLEAILVLATPYSQLAGTYLSDVALDTAVSHFSGEDRRAVDVEVCRCPVGYRGTSCEVQYLVKVQVAGYLKNSENIFNDAKCFFFSLALLATTEIHMIDPYQVLLVFAKNARAMITKKAAS